MVRLAASGAACLVCGEMIGPIGLDLRRLKHRLWCWPFRPRLVVAMVVAMAAALVLPSQLGVAERIVTAWDAGVFCDLFLALRMMASATPETMRIRAQREDETRWVILAVTVGAALVSLVAVGVVLHHAKGLPTDEAILKVALAGVTLLCSWFFTNTVFALHYAHEYYAPGSDQISDGGLAFPDEPLPDYWDFLYFAFVLAMTFQVSDVQITSRHIRRLALAHGIVAFFFATVILALSINIIAGLL